MAARARAILVLLALFSMNLLNYIDRYVLAAVLKPVQDTFGISDTWGGALFTAFMLSYALFSPLVGWLADRYSRKYLLAAGIGVWSLATFGTALAESYWQLFLTRAFLGIGEATYATIAPTLIADLFPRTQRSRALAFFYVAIPCGSALGYALGGSIEAHWGWRSAFLVVGLPGLAMALASLAIREPKRGAIDWQDEAAPPAPDRLPLAWRTYAELFRNRSFVTVTLGSTLSTFALGGLAAWAPTFLVVQRGLAAESADLWLGTTLAIGGILGTALGGWLGDSLARRTRGAYFWLSGVATLLASPLVVLALISHEPQWIFGWMLAALVFAFLNTGPASAIVINVTSPTIRAEAFAINILLIHLLGDLPSPLLMGSVADLTGSIFWGLAVTVPVLALGGLLYCLGAPHLERDERRAIATNLPPG